MAFRRPAGPLVVAIEGPSGSGKSTVSNRVAQAFGFRRIPEAFERIRPQLSLRFSSSHGLLRIERRLISDELSRYALAQRLRRTGTSVVLDTGFVGPLTYVWGLRAMSKRPDVVAPVRRYLQAMATRGRWGLPDVSVFLDVPVAERRRRIARARSTHPAELEARHRAVGRFERTLWTHRFPRLMQGRVLRIDGRPPVNEVVRAIRRAIGALSDRDPPDSSDAQRLLRGFRAGPRSTPGRRSGKS